MKKLLSIVLIIALLFSMGTVSFAVAGTFQASSGSGFTPGNNNKYEEGKDVFFKYDTPNYNMSNGISFKLPYDGVVGFDTFDRETLEFDVVNFSPNEENVKVTTDGAWKIITLIGFDEVTAETLSKGFVLTWQAHLAVSGRTDEYSIDAKWTDPIKNLNLTIIPAPTPLEVTGYTGIYDGNSHSITVTGTMTGDTVLYSTDDGLTWSETNPGYTNVGTYPVKVKVTNDNYADRTGQATVKIDPKPVTIEVDDKTKVFGAADPTFTGTVGTLVAAGDLGTVSYSRTGTDEAVGVYADVLDANYTTNANYTVTVTKGDFTITNATGQGLGVTGYTGTYDGDSHSITVTGTMTGDTVLYSTDDGLTWSETNPGYTNVGTYTVKVKVTNDNYDDRTGQATVTINPKPVTIEVDDKTKVFGAADPTFTGTVGTLVAAGDLGTVSYTRTGTDEAVGVYAEVLDAEYTANENYDVTVTKGDFTITNATGQGLGVTGYTGTYDGNSHSITVTGTMTGDTVLYSTNDGETWSETNPGYTNVGTYTVKVKVTNDNYDDRTGQATVKIDPKPVTIEVDDKTKVFGAADPTFTGTVGTLVAAGDLGTVRYTRTGTDEAVGVYAGVLDANYTTNANYTVTVTKGDFTITNATGQGLGVTGYTGTYDGNSHSITVTGTMTGDTVLYSTNDGETWSETNPGYTNVGTYTVKVKVTNDNYDDRTGEATVTINPKPVTIEVDDKTKVFGDADPTFTGKVGTLVAAGDLGTVSYSRTGTDEAVGVYAEVLDAEYTANENYDVTVTKGDFAITAKVITGGGGSSDDPGIKIEKDVDLDEASIGDTVVYTIEVENNGDYDLENVIVVDEMIDETWDIGDLDEGEDASKTFRYTLQEGDFDEDGLFVNTAVVKGKWSRGTVSEEASATVEEVIIEVTEEDVAETTPELPDVVPEKVVLPAPAVPQALPKTGQVPPELFYGLGSILMAAGYGLGRKKKD